MTPLERIKRAEAMAKCAAAAVKDPNLKAYAYSAVYQHALEQLK